jgi:hypothetical protein
MKFAASFLALLAVAQTAVAFPFGSAELAVDAVRARLSQSGKH